MSVDMFDEAVKVYKALKKIDELLEAMVNVKGQLNMDTKRVLWRSRKVMGGIWKKINIIFEEDKNDVDRRVEKEGKGNNKT